MRRGSSVLNPDDEGGPDRTSASEGRHRGNDRLCCAGSLRLLEARTARGPFLTDSRTVCVISCVMADWVGTVGTHEQNALSLDPRRG